MAKKKTVEPEIEEIKKGLADKKAIIGTDRTMKALRAGNLTKIFLTSNVPEEVKMDITTYSNIGNVEVVDLKQTNEELGIICRKPFFVSVLSFKKDGEN